MGKLSKEGSPKGRSPFGDNSSPSPSHPAKSQIWLGTQGPPTKPEISWGKKGEGDKGGEVSNSSVAHRLDPLYYPKSIAFIGASSVPLKWGHRILLNLLNGGYPGRVYPVNPREKEVLGLRVYAAIRELPETPDLALIVIPPPAVPPIVKECVERGVKVGLIITAGFAEMGGEGKRLEQEAVKIAREGGMFLVGPNCNGVMNPSIKLYCSMPPIYPKSGPLAIATQSGNVGTSIIRRAITYGLGFSKYASTGNEADLHSEDFIEYMGEDPETKVIMTYIEGLKDAPRFFQVAKKVTQEKPIIALKVGVFQAGAKAARSHTGALSGSDSAFDALCKQTGIVRARDQDELFHIATGFLGQPLPKSRRVGIVTGGGGWGVLASDACARVGLDVVDLPSDTIHEMDAFLPPWWNRGNPVDLVAGLNETDIENSLKALVRCPNVDGIILLLGIRHLWRLGIRLGKTNSAEHPAYAQCYKTIANLVRESGGNVDMMEMIKDLIAQYGKPIILAEERMEIPSEIRAEALLGLEDKDMTFCPSPDAAAQIMVSLAKYAEYLRGEPS